MTTDEAAAGAAVVTGSLDKVGLLSAVFVVLVDCIEEEDTADEDSTSPFGSKVDDEVTCCLGDNEKRALCEVDDEEMETPPVEAEALPDFESG